MLRIAPLLLLALAGCTGAPAGKDTGSGDTDTNVTDDLDGDGYTTADDCDDTDSTINPGATETYYDGIDQNCDALSDNDMDMDGHDASAQGGDDCADDNAAISPEAEEVCDGIDNDCEGTIDEGAVDGVLIYADVDLDTYGDPLNPGNGCGDTVPDGYVLDATDCNDADAAINPLGVETCDGVDQNCDGSIDEGIATTAWYADADADGWGDMTAVDNCMMPEGYLATSGDCDDANAAANPDMVELCNGFDDNCDSEIDEDTASDAGVYYMDADTDGYGDSSTMVTSCEAPIDYVIDGTDCDDSDAAVNSAATEACNGYDDDCDGDTDEAGATGESTFYADIDSDGYGDADSTMAACDMPIGYVADNTDCNDGSGSAHPGATEVCDAANTDEDCDGLADEAGASGESTFYMDSDGDSYGDAGSTTVGCDLPSGYVANSTDCDDTDDQVKPGGVETCNDYDDDCDSAIDEAGSVGEGTWYTDADGDTYGGIASAVSACDQPAGTIVDNTDCDDGDDMSYPGATELCDGADNDCDGSTADEAGMATWTDGSVWTDVTSMVSGGTSTTPKIIGDYTTGSGVSFYMTSGTLYLCDGTWYNKAVFASPSTTTTASIIGRNGAAATTMTTGGASGSIVASTNARLTIDGFTLTGGIGGGTSGNRKGGAVAVSQTTGSALPSTPNVTLQDCIVTANTATYGGAIDVENYGWVSIIDTEISSNAATSAGGGAWVQNYGKVSCSASALGNSSFYLNTATYGGGIYLSNATGGSVSATGCDFGADSSADDNATYDVQVAPVSGTHHYCYTNAVALTDTVTCTGGTCTSTMTDATCP